MRRFLGRDGRLVGSQDRIVCDETEGLFRIAEQLPEKPVDMEARRCSTFGFHHSREDDRHIYRLNGRKLSRSQKRFHEIAVLLFPNRKPACRGLALGRLDPELEEFIQRERAGVVRNDATASLLLLKTKFLALCLSLRAEGFRDPSTIGPAVLW